MRAPRRDLVAAGVAVAAALALAGCTAGGAGSSGEAGDLATGAAGELVDGHWDPADAEVAQAQPIDLASGSVVIDRPGAYRLSGDLADGQVLVDTAQDGLVQLILDGASITSGDSSAINVQSADEVVIILAAGSDNSVTDAAAYAQPGEEPDAAIFSKADLSIAGDGALTVAGRAGDAIASKDGLELVGGSVTVVAADDAVKGRDYVRLSGGSLTVTAEGDGVKSTNADDPGAGYVLWDGASGDIDAGTDCVQAATDLLVTSGQMRLTCGDDGLTGDASASVTGGEIDILASYEGIEAPVVSISGGRIAVTASDDGINAAASSTAEDSAGDAAGDGDGDGGGAAEPGQPGGRDRGGRPGGGGPMGGGMGGWAIQEGVSLSISGGEVEVRAGSDGIDANGPGVISGGRVVVYAPGRGMDGPFDIAESGPTITGGEVWAFATEPLGGSSGGRFGGSMGGQINSPTAESTQAWVAAQFAGPVEAGQEIALTGPDGQTLAAITVADAVTALVVSAPGIEDGAEYQLSAAGQTATASAGQSEPDPG
ncbi:MAG: carbohydrate-binding domain-containing protein [Bifidobacteriaceae bacterium]|nr:carbohydrate-binding domain-containing protein [Bifidobacteriaceae bacterium]